MAYNVILKRTAEKELAALPEKLHDQVAERLLALKTEPRPAGIKKLRGREGYRLRVSDYRILYVVDDRAKSVEVFSIAHRREVYRR